MQTFTPDSVDTRHVLALFCDGTHAFPLKAGATFFDLATLFESADPLHEGEPLAIQVHFERANDVTPRSCSSL